MNLIRLLDDSLRRVNWKKELILLPALVLVVVTFQWLDGAYESEFGGHPDEAAHYVTGLMVRDYIAAGFPTTPMAYAKDYYDHYPKVALGNWPPLFYVIQAAWTLPFGVSRESVLLLMAVLTALVARVLFKVLEAEFSRVHATVGALLFLALPLVQQHAAMVMNEIPVTLFSFLAVLSFGRFLDREEAPDSVLFGLFASAAILTKGSGLFLAFVPPLALLLARQSHLLRRPAFWSSSVIVAVLCGPWTIHFRDVSRGGWLEQTPSLHFTAEAVKYYPYKLYAAVGIGLTLLAMIGLAVKLWPAKSEARISGRWASLGAAMISVVIFHSIMPVGYEPRHLIPALPALVLFIVTGFEALLPWLRQRGLTRQASVALLLSAFAGAFLWQTFKFPQKGCQGFTPIAEIWVKIAGSPLPISLISSDARGEGQWISEVAMRERRPSHTIRRASKVLASASWGGNRYKPKATDTKELLEILQREKIAWVIVDKSIPPDKRRPHHELLEKTLEEPSDLFTLVGQWYAQRDGRIAEDRIQVYFIVQRTNAFNR
jgi:hypothetical protein